MNNSCPSCGAIYNVASKDIGRKLKCKKCHAALKVTDEGLELDTPTASAPPAGSKPAAAVVADDDDERDEDDDEPVVRKKKGKPERERGPRGNPLAFLEPIGGMSTIIFAFGVFLVIVFTSLPIIGAAGTDRAQAYVDKLKIEQATKKKNLIPKGKKPSDLTSDELKKIEEDSKKIDDDYEKRLNEAVIDAENTAISNRRDVWLERYGLMFGFIFVSFGCIGYLRTEQPLVLKVIMGIILAFMMMVMFGTFGIQGCTGGSSPVPRPSVLGKG